MAVTGVRSLLVRELGQVNPFFIFDLMLSIFLVLGVPLVLIFPHIAHITHLLLEDFFFRKATDSGVLVVDFQCGENLNILSTVSSSTSLHQIGLGTKYEGNLNSFELNMSLKGSKLPRSFVPFFKSFWSQSRNVIAACHSISMNYF